MVHEIAAVILAGGRSSRLGAFKPLVRLAGKPLICYSLEIASFTSEPYIIVSNSAQSEAIMEVIGKKRAKIIVESKERVEEAEDHDTYHNNEENKDRPLHFTSAISRVYEDLIFLMACDTPFLDPLLPKLLSLHIGDSSAVVPAWPNGYLEPLAALYRKEPLSKMNSATTFRDLLFKIGARTVAIEILGVSPESFLNINTPSDLERAEAFLRKRNKEI
ncbi:MAG: molybdenum cofactor guanylyltransferase [Candidatus Methanomethylicaceae archaeon]